MVSEDRSFGDEGDEGDAEGGEFEGGDFEYGPSPDASSKDAVVFLVDCHPEMFVKDESKTTKFQYVLKLYADMLKRKIVSESKNDQFGLVFFSTKAKQNPNNLPGVFVFQSLAPVSASMIRKGQTLSDGDPNKVIGGSEPKAVEFNNVLWAVQTLFADLNKAYSKRIFLFTTRDDPTDGSEAARAKSIAKYKDLEEVGITLELFPTPLKEKEDAFDVKKFFMHIIEVAPDEDTGRIKEKFRSNFEDLENMFRGKTFTKRSLATMPFQIADGVNVGVKLYCIVRPTNPGSAVQVDKTSGEKLQCLTRYLDKDTGGFLQDHEIETYLPYGDAAVTISRAEMNEIKTFGEPGLTLMGFKAKTKLKFYHNIKPPYFVYPDDTQFQNSTVAFSALLNRMLAAVSLSFSLEVGLSFLFLLFSRQGNVPEHPR
jgi:ATP-dependent DNA helicase 2 subunit 1